MCGERLFEIRIKAALEMLDVQAAPLLEGPHSAPIMESLRPAWYFENGMRHNHIAARPGYTKRVYDQMVVIPPHSAQVQNFCKQDC